MSPASMASERALATGYTSETDSVGEQDWHRLLERFNDASIYQTWPYAATMAGGRVPGRLLLKKDGEVVAAAAVRITKAPALPLGVAYVYWGPVWRRAGQPADPECFRQAIRALRNEYVCRRRLILRVLPPLFEDGAPPGPATLVEEGLGPAPGDARRQTILMDLSPQLSAVRAAINPKWRRDLASAEKAGFEVSIGGSDALFAAFLPMYREMVSRKGFREPNDINRFRRVQRLLPDKFKLRIAICSSAAGPCAGLIWSAMGDTAIELFGATGGEGRRGKASYLLHWMAVGALKQDGIPTLNLNGINPITNPGGYMFKSRLAGALGKEVYLLGRFDAYPSRSAQAALRLADAVRKWYRAEGGASRPPSAPAPEQAAAG